MIDKLLIYVLDYNDTRFFVRETVGWRIWVFACFALQIALAKI